MRPSPNRAAAALALALLLAGGLAACTPDTPTTTDDGASQVDTDDSTSGGDDTDDSGATSGVVVSGTGTYLIGQDLPYGGYQLSGEPVEQPAGCTWAILDGDGAVLYADQGSYAFLEDVPEYVTFQTSGCPDWEQFE